MENSANKMQKVVVEKKKQYDKMFYWKYDDKSYKSILYDTESGCTDVVRNHSNNAALNFAKQKSYGADIETAELEFSSGVTKSIDRELFAKVSEAGLLDRCAEA